jgi:hypothetical protein
MRTVLPSGPKRDDRTELSPVEGIIEYSKRHPRTTAFLAGTFSSGFGGIPAAALVQVGLWASSDFRIMKQTAQAHYYDRKANRMREAGNTKRATQASKQADKIRRRIATM